MMNKTLLIILFSTLAIGVTSTSWANSLTAIAQSDLAQKNLTGLWLCEGTSRTVKYNSFIEYNKNATYKETGKTQFYLNGEWISVPYEGQGSWSLQAQKYLKVTGYSSTILIPPRVEPEVLQKIQTDLNQSAFHLAEVIRSNGKMLVLQYKTAFNQTATLRCNKKRA